MANGSMRRTGQDHRGSARDRRARRAWLVRTFTTPAGGFACHLCGTPLVPDAHDWHVDRWPVPGCQGGRYVRGNIRPACAPCNVAHTPAQGA